MSRPRPRDGRPDSAPEPEPPSSDAARVTAIRAHPDHPGLLTLEIGGTVAGTLPRSEIDPDEIVEGLSADDPRVVAAIRSIHVRAARALALDLLAARAHASEELARKLERRSFTANVVRVVIEELLEDGWLDDAGFAATRIAEWRRAGRSDAECRRRLEAAGLVVPNIEAGFETATPSATPDGELDAATETVSAELGAAITAFHRLERSGRIEDPATIRRAAAKLARRGFDADTIRSALRACGVDDAPLDEDWTPEDAS
ncbi:MAG: hypothetical protein CMJ54_06920 [Planctomycetaceae bacterium]|nr:hypothetical protein [Planctomycetaceae bacterium]